eukprot:271285_1
MLLGALFIVLNNSVFEAYRESKTKTVKSHQGWKLSQWTTFLQCNGDNQWGIFDEKKMMNHQPTDQIQLIEPLQYLVIQLLLLFMVIGGKKFDADYYRNKNKQDNTRCDYISIGSRYIEIGCGCAHIGTACIDIVMKIHKIGC